VKADHSLALYGQAILDYFEGNHRNNLISVDELGRRTEVPVRLFFREFEEFPNWEKNALDLCRGKVLDIGGGAGRHSLVLQERGMAVCAIDVVQDCVTVMKRRGVRDAHCADVLEFNGGPFDTLLGVMNGLTIVERLEKLPAFLQSIRRLIDHGGQFLVDSTDLRCSADTEFRTLAATKASAGKYFGELTAHLEYKDKRGPLLQELFVDPATLREAAIHARWDCEIILSQENGRYLARLTPLK
jgi:2-polyprenyl-3-methyl-5-hydroxy-6-metoxy-1,4-benzoquinol methylase